MNQQQKQLSLICREFLSDPRVIEIPQLLWQIILRGDNFTNKTKEDLQKHIQLYGQMKGSPLLVIAQKQLELVRRELKSTTPKYCSRACYALW